jgi:6-pyruvoyltetrahydropterin/6-carboxytetrahydropterin synthase
MIEIFKTYSFDAAHLLPFVADGHPCKRLHGHTYQTQFFIKGDVSAVGFVLDFHEMDAIIKPEIARLDHSFLNDTIQNPSSENLVLYFARILLPSIPNISKIIVQETPKTGAIWVNQ